MTRSSQCRLDVALVDRDLADTRERAQALIAAGMVEVGSGLARSSSQVVGAETALRIVGRAHPWASRGGVKLAAALDAFAIDCRDRVALDCGASTGGFTDVLLHRGAVRVHAVDVGRGLLAPRLANDPRVTVLDRTNIRHLSKLDGPVPTLVTLDLSFISLRAVLPAITALAAAATVVALFKPQFEVAREAVGRGGVVRDPGLAAAALEEFLAWAFESLAAITASAPIPAPIRGAKGNQEWLVHLRLCGSGGGAGQGGRSG